MEVIDTPTEATRTTVVQQAVEIGPQPWLGRHLITLIALLLTAVVCWLALRGDRDAIVALMGSYGTLIGVLFGGNTALKIPGKDN